MQHPMKKKKKHIHVLCATDYEVVLRFQDMMTLMRHMLLDGHLAEQRDTKIPQEQEVKIPPCSALPKAWPSVRSARFIDANSYAVASPLIIVGETKKQTRTDNQVPLTILCIL